MLTPFWKTFLRYKQLFDTNFFFLKTIIFQRSKNYGSPTPVTRSKTASSLKKEKVIKLAKQISLHILCELYLLHETKTYDERLTITTRKL